MQNVGNVEGFKIQGATALFDMRVLEDPSPQLACSVREATSRQPNNPNRRESMGTHHISPLPNPSTPHQKTP